MNKSEYKKRMAEHDKQFENLWSKIVQDTNTFIESNPNELGLDNNSHIEKFSDKLSLSGGWIQDRLENLLPTQRKSTSSKLRKALGFHR